MPVRILSRITAWCLSSSIAGDSLRSDSSSRAESYRSCHCPHQIVSRTRTKVVFSGLNQDERYFPMVARAENLTFFGVPPAPISLKATIATRARSPEQTVRPKAGERQPTTNSGHLSGHGEENLTSARSLAAPENSVSQSPHWRLGRRKEETGEQSDTDQTLLEQDEKNWQTWHEQEMHHEFARLIPRSEKNDFVCWPHRL